jgi:hypothetical protein
MVIEYTWWLTGIFCSHWVHFIVIWYIFPRFDSFHREKSGNPDFSVKILLRIRRKNRLRVKPADPRSAVAYANALVCNYR